MRLKCLYCYTIACVVWMTMQAAVLRAQSPAGSATPEAWHFQYDLFQFLLEQQGLAPVTKLDQAFIEPRESVIVIAGDPARLPPSSRNQLLEFVRSGGALLLATDDQATVRGIAQFMQGPVRAADPETRYQGYDDCVKVTAIAGTDPRLAGVSTIVTNRAGWLQLPADSSFAWDAMATFSKTCLPPESRGEPLLAIGHSEQDAGVVVVASDASLFTNGMLWHGDNAILAIRLSSLLGAAGRTRLAFWADGQLLASLRNRIESQARASQPNVRVEAPLPEPDLKKLLKLGNAIAHEVARSNVLNETLQHRPRHQRPSQYFRWLLIMATAAMFMAALWILISSGTLRPFSAGGRKAARRTARGQRALAAGELTDYRTPAGYLAREVCWELTGSRHSADWQKYLARQLVFEPTLSPSAQQDLAKIVDIASRGCRERMTASDFEQLGKTIAALRAKHAATIAVPHFL